MTDALFEELRRRGFEESPAGAVGQRRFIGSCSDGRIVAITLRPTLELTPTLMAVVSGADGTLLAATSDATVEWLGTALP